MYPLAKNVFIFWYCYLVTNFRIFIIILYMPSLISVGFILIVLWSVLLYKSTINHLIDQYKHFWVLNLYLWILFFKVLINLLTTIDFPSLCVEYSSIHYLATKILLIYCKIQYLYLSIFCLVWDTTYQKFLEKC